MEEEYLEDPLIEFVKVEGNNDFDHRFVNDAEIEDPNLLPRPKKIRKIVRYHTISNTGTRKVVQVKQFTRKNEVMSTMPMPYSNGIRKIAHIRQIAKNNDGVSTTSVPENYANRNIVKHLTSKREDEIRRKKRLIEAHHPNKEEKRYKKNMIPMSEEKTIALISRIEKEPCIWDRKHDNYRNKDIKEKAWNRVVGNTGIPLQILKAKWASILGSFRHYKSQHIKYQVNRPNWFAYDALGFMLKSAESEYQTEDTEVPSATMSTDETKPTVEQYDSQHIEEEYLSLNVSPEKRTQVREDTADSIVSDGSSNAEILRIVRSMSKVLNKIANIGMPVDYGRYVNQHLKEYDEEIRRKTVKGIMELITAADEEMAVKYPDRSTTKL